MTPKLPLKLKIQIYRGDAIAMGPGKADLLDHIIETGSISAAGRRMGVSYRRCWMLVDVMNRCWAQPLVETSAGGTSGGGARVTETGRRVLALYRALQRRLDGASECPELSDLQALLLPVGDD